MFFEVCTHPPLNVSCPGTPYNIVLSSFRQDMTTASSSTQVVKLNVGGVRYITSKSTLSKLGDNFLTRLLENDENGKLPCQRDDEGYIFIDRNGKLFGIILDFLRVGRLFFSNKIDPRQLQLELDFYGIEPPPEAQARTWQIGWNGMPPTLAETIRDQLEKDTQEAYRLISANRRLFVDKLGTLCRRGWVERGTIAVELLSGTLCRCDTPFQREILREALQISLGIKLESVSYNATTHCLLFSVDWRDTTSDHLSSLLCHWKAEQSLQMPDNETNSTKFVPMPPWYKRVFTMSLET